MMKDGDMPELCYPIFSVIYRLCCYLRKYSICLGIREYYLFIVTPEALVY